MLGLVLASIGAGVGLILSVFACRLYQGFVLARSESRYFATGSEYSALIS
jgi:hypothetical protein